MARNSLPTTEQNGHDQGVRETDLDTVDEAIPSTLQNSEVVMVSWVGEYVLDAAHRRVEVRICQTAVPRGSLSGDRGNNHMQQQPGSIFPRG